VKDNSLTTISGTQTFKKPAPEEAVYYTFVVILRSNVIIMLLKFQYWKLGGCSFRVIYWLQRQWFREW